MTKLLTIIIPTYNRSEDLARTLQFLAKQFSDLRIIVADGSDEHTSRLNTKRYAKADDLTYLHCPLEPPENSWQNYFRRIDSALRDVQTPYTAFCADDDLLVVDNAIKSAEFLEANPQYIGCHGHYLQFERFGDTIRIPDLEYQGPSINSDGVPGRLLQLFSRYEAPTYAVFRTEVSRLLWERGREQPPPLWPEIYHATAAVISGKIHRSNTIYCLRNIGNPPHYRESSSFMSFGEYISANLEGFLAEYRHFRTHAVEWSDPAVEPGILIRALDLSFMTYIGSEFNSSHWIDCCCATVQDQTEREKLRDRLSRNFYRNATRRFIPSIRGSIHDFVTAMRERRTRDRWTELTKDATARCYKVSVKSTLLEQFPKEQWDLLKGIEKE